MTVENFCKDGNYECRVVNSHTLLRIDPRLPQVYLLPDIVLPKGKKLMVLDTRSTLVDTTVLNHVSGSQHRMSITEDRPASKKSSMFKNIRQKLTRALTATKCSKSTQCTKCNEPVSTAIEMDLNSFNHCKQRLDSVEEYDAVLKEYLEMTQERNAIVVDAITGKSLDIEKQTIQIEMEAGDISAINSNLIDCTFVNASMSSVITSGDRVRHADRIAVVSDDSCSPASYKLRYIDEQEPGILTNTSGNYGNYIEVEELEIVVPLKGIERTHYQSVHNMDDMSKILVAPAPQRSEGVFEVQPVLIRANPGTGKTWSLQQLVFKHTQSQLFSSEPVKLVPLLVTAQTLAHNLHSQSMGSESEDLSEAVKRAGEKMTDGVNKFTQASSQQPNLVLEYIQMEYANFPCICAMLKIALEMRALVLFLDGIDEAARFKYQIEDLVLNHTDLTGLRKVVTSRPEGVRLHRLAPTHVVMNLKPPTNDQQHKVISQQIKDDEFIQNLYNMCKARTLLDKAYSKGFAEKEDRDVIEGRKFVDRFKLETETGETNKFDPSLRQSCVNNSRIVSLQKDNTHMRSKSILTATKFFHSMGLLSAIDIVLGRHFGQQLTNEAMRDKPRTKLEVEKNRYDHLVSVNSNATDKRGHAIVASEVNLRQDIALLVKLCMLMYEITDQQVFNASNMWDRICSRTDEILEVAEIIKPFFDEVVEKIIGDTGQCHAEFGPLKDPLRIHEKAQNDYSKRFSDNELPESIVFDVVRATIVADTVNTFAEIFDVLYFCGSCGTNVCRDPAAPQSYTRSPNTIK